MGKKKIKTPKTINVVPLNDPKADIGKGASTPSQVNVEGVLRYINSAGGSEKVSVRRGVPHGRHRK